MRILVVESEILIAMEVAEILREAIVCDSLATTWMNFPSTAGGEAFDIVVADRDVSQSTLSLLDEMEQTREAARVYLTTDSMERPLALGGGIDVAKPFDAATLLQAVRGSAPSEAITLQTRAG